MASCYRVCEEKDSNKVSMAARCVLCAAQAECMTLPRSDVIVGCYPQDIHLHSHVARKEKHSAPLIKEKGQAQRTSDKGKHSAPLIKEQIGRGGADIIGRRHGDVAVVKADPFPEVSVERRRCVVPPAQPTIMVAAGRKRGERRESHAPHSRSHRCCGEGGRERRESEARLRQQERHLTA